MSGKKGGKKDWSLDDFTEPKSRNVLEETTNKPKKVKKVKTITRQYERNTNRDGRIIVYMTKEEEIKVRKQASKEGMSAAAYGRHKLELDKSIN